MVLLGVLPERAADGMLARASCGLAFTAPMLPAALNDVAGLFRGAIACGLRRVPVAHRGRGREERLISPLHPLME